MNLSAELARPELAGTRWSVVVTSSAGEEWLAHNPAELLRTASVAKIFLLIDVAARIERGELDPAMPLERASVAPVADSGLWQHLRTGALPLDDVACLVGALSDNWATNVLLDLVGLEAVHARAAELAPGGSTLYDLVREERGPTDPETLSRGCASDWVRIMARLAAGDIVSQTVSRRVLDWLALNVDHSMVSAGFGLDPLSTAGRGLGLSSKTGSDRDVCAEVGVVTGAAATAAFAVICNWDDDNTPQARDEAFAFMRRLGSWLRKRVS